MCYTYIGGDLVSRFWNGTKEVTKQELLDFFSEQFRYWGAYQVWTDKPDHFLEADYTPTIYVIMYSMDDQFGVFH